jgi:hypothetical protein
VVIAFCFNDWHPPNLVSQFVDRTNHPSSILVVILQHFGGNDVLGQTQSRRPQRQRVLLR